MGAGGAAQRGDNCVVASIAAWTARETYNIPMHDLGEPDHATATVCGAAGLPPIQGRRGKFARFGFCRSAARDGGMARQPGLGGQPDRRVRRAVAAIAARWTISKKKPSGRVARIGLEELAAPVPVVEDVSVAQPRICSAVEIERASRSS